MKCSFTIENIQNWPYQNLQPIINTRYWTTPPYKGTCFNDFYILLFETKYSG